MLLSPSPDPWWSPARLPSCPLSLSRCYLYFHCFRQPDCLASWVCGMVSTQPHETRNIQPVSASVSQSNSSYTAAISWWQSPVTSVSVWWPQGGCQCLQCAQCPQCLLLRTTTGWNWAWAARSRAGVRRNTRAGSRKPASSRPFSAFSVRLEISPKSSDSSCDRFQ